MPDLKTQISRLTEISLLLLTLGFFVPISLFFFQQALLVIQLGLSHPKTLSDLANSINLFWSGDRIKLAAIILRGSSLATLTSAFSVYIAQKSLNKFRQFLDEFEVNTISNSLFKILTIILLSAIFATSLSSSFNGFFLL